MQQLFFALFLSQAAVSECCLCPVAEPLSQQQTMSRKLSGMLNEIKIMAATRVLMRLIERNRYDSPNEILVGMEGARNGAKEAPSAILKPVPIRRLPTQERRQELRLRSRD